MEFSIRDYFKRVIDLYFDYNKSMRTFSIQFLLFFTLIFFVFIVIFNFFCEKFIFNNQGSTISDLFANSLFLYKVINFISSSILITCSLYAIYFKYYDNNEQPNITSFFNSIPAETYVYYFIFLVINILFSLLFYTTTYSGKDTFAFLPVFNESFPIFSRFIYKLSQVIYSFYPFIALFIIAYKENKLPIKLRPLLAFLLLTFMINSLFVNIVNYLASTFFFPLIETSYTLFYLLFIAIQVILSFFTIFLYVVATFATYENEINFSDHLSNDEIIDHLLEK